MDKDDIKIVAISTISGVVLITLSFLLGWYYEDISDKIYFAFHGSNSENNSTDKTDTSSNGGYNSTTKISVELADVDYGFINASGVTDDSELTIASTSKSTSFDVIENYYFLVSYTMTARENNSGTSLLYTTISFDNARFIDGNVYTTRSDQTPTKTTIKDSASGNNKLELSISNKVPDSKDESTTVLIVIEMTTLQYGTTYMSCSFGGSDLNLSGDDDGFGKSLEINKVQLADPVLSFDSSTLEFKWNHVENADYYKLFVDSELLKDTDGKDVNYSVDSYVATGSEIAWDISGYVSGTHRVKIQAFSNSANFIISNYSNEVTATL